MKQIKRKILKKVASIHPIAIGTKVTVQWQHMYSFHKGKTFKIIGVVGKNPLEYRLEDIETKMQCSVLYNCIIKIENKVNDIRLLTDKQIIILTKNGDKEARKEFILRFKKIPNI